MISEDAHVIMPYHRRMDMAREKMKGEKKIGTTGRGSARPMRTRSAGKASGSAT